MEQIKNNPADTQAERQMKILTGYFAPVAKKLSLQTGLPETSLNLVVEAALRVEHILRERKSKDLAFKELALRGMTNRYSGLTGEELVDLLRDTPRMSKALAEMMDERKNPLSSASLRRTVISRLN